MFDATRRAVVQMLGFSPVILPRMGEAGIRHAIASGAAFGVSGTFKGPSPDAPAQPGQPIGRDSWRGKIYEALDQLNEREYLVRETTKHGFDPDIASMRSVSHSYKMLMQTRRLQERNDFQRTVRRFLDDPASYAIEGIFNGGQDRVGR